MLILEYSLFTLQIMDGIRLEPFNCLPRRYYNVNRIHLSDVTLLYVLSFIIIIIIILMYVKQ